MIVKIIRNLYNGVTDFVFEVGGYLFLNGAFYSEQTKLRAIKGICNKKVFFKSYIELKNSTYLQTRENIYKLNSRWTAIVILKIIYVSCMEKELSTKLHDFVRLAKDIED